MIGAGEGTALVAEEFAFEQCLGEGGAVDGQERAIAAAAVVIDGPRHEFLAGTALAEDQDHRVLRGDPTDGLVDLLHGRGVADDLVGVACGVAGGFNDGGAAADLDGPVGGLTLIPGGVKSKANVASGGRTLWANFTNAICLIIYLLIAAPLIGLIPRGVLAAVLIYTGWKMCEPLVWKHMAHIGMEQLAIFTFTVLVTLVTDLLWGIAAGVAAKFVLNLVLYRQAIVATGTDEPRPSLIQSALEMFRDPIGRRELRNGRLHVYLDKPLVCFNTMRLSQELGQLPAEAQALTIHLNAQAVGLIDHTSCENLMDVVRDYSDSEIPVEVVGLDDMKPLSDYHACTRVALAVVPAS